MQMRVKPRAALPAGKLQSSLGYSSQGTHVRGFCQSSGFSGPSSYFCLFPLRALSSWKSHWSSGRMPQNIESLSHNRTRTSVCGGGKGNLAAEGERVASQVSDLNLQFLSRSPTRSGGESSEVRRVGTKSQVGTFTWVSRRSSFEIQIILRHFKSTWAAFIKKMEIDFSYSKKRYF